MLCATCGVMNPDTAPRCGNCGAPLERKVGSHATQGVSPWFAPVAHSPFNDEPLPQPSGPLSRIQPDGEIQAFTPQALPVEQRAQVTPTTPATFADLALADYPTDVNVPVPHVSATPAFAATHQGSQPGMLPPVYAHQAPTNRFTTPTSWSGADNYAAQQNGWQQEESYAAMYQAPPASQLPYAPAYPGQQQNNWQQEESYAAMYQAPPVSQALGQVYPGSVGNTSPTSQALGNIYPGPGLSSGALPNIDMHPLVRPLPLWAFLLSSVAGLGLLSALVFLIPAWDWATGASIAGTIALFAALLLLIVGGMRVALGLLDETNPRRRAQVICTVLLVLLLFLVSGLGITQQTSLHAAQARSLEAHQNWQMALDEYKASGEKAPNSVSLARVYNEWGEDLSTQGHYTEAVEHFSTVLQSYSQVSDQSTRARTNLLAAYLAWGDQAAQVQDYVGATSHYDALLALSYCNTDCKNQAGAKDASAYGHLAEQQLGAQQFAPAVSAFAALTTRFASSPEAKKYHFDYSSALWGLGQQQLNTVCSDAVKTYQQLAQQFSDTDNGKQAATALKQPVTVKGHFTTKLPGAPYTPTVALVHGLVAGIKLYQFPPLLHGAPMVPINSDGTFTFTGVPQGDYELIWSYDGTLHFAYATNGNQVYYTAHLGPLCTYDYGDINETITVQP